MRFIYAGVLSLCHFWYYATGIYGEYHWGFSAACVALSVICFFAGSLRTSDRHKDLAAFSNSRRIQMLLGVVGLLWLCCFSYPFNIAGFSMLMAALFAFAFPGRSVPFVAAWVFAIAAVSHTAVWHLARAIFSKSHALFGLTIPTAWMLRALGEDASVLGHTITVNTQHGNATFLSTFESAQLTFFLLLLVAAAQIIAMFNGSRRAQLKLALVVGGFAFLRYVFVVLLTLSTQITQPLHSAHVMALTSLVLLALLPTRLDIAPKNACANNALSDQPRRRWLPFVPWAGAAVALAAFLGLSQPGKAKSGCTIMVNEHRSNWEDTRVAYDTMWYGDRVGYNYYLLRQYLSYFGDVVVNERPLSEVDLSEVDVLILKTPTERYSDAEVGAVNSFIVGGGGVLMMGDHTNVFGMSSHLNQIAKGCGLEYKFNSQHHVTTGGMTTYYPHGAYEHPAVHNMPYFLFGTGCTLQPSLFAEDIITGGQNRTLPLDYSVSNFFYQGKKRLLREFGYCSQICGMAKGKGRAIAFSDSTTYSNFWMFMQGKPELLLGMIGWLNKTNVMPNVKVMSFAALVLSGLLMSWPTTSSLNLRTLTFCAALVAATLLVGKVNRFFYSPLAAVKEIPYVAFCREGSDYYLPRDVLSPRPESVSANRENALMPPVFNSLYMTPARLGFIPREFDSAADAVASNPKLIVLVDPIDGLSHESLGKLTSYVSAGGRLLVLGVNNSSIPETRSIANEFGIEIADELTEADSLWQPTADGKSSITFPFPVPFTAIANATAILGDEQVNTKEGKAALAIKRCGKGMVAITTCGELWQDTLLGASNQVPTLPQLKLRVIAYTLFENLYMKNLDEFAAVPRLNEYFGEDLLAEVRKGAEAQKKAAAQIKEAEDGKAPAAKTGDDMAESASTGDNATENNVPRIRGTRKSDNQLTQNQNSQVESSESTHP